MTMQRLKLNNELDPHFMLKQLEIENSTTWLFKQDQASNIDAELTIVPLNNLSLIKIQMP